MDRPQISFQAALREWAEEERQALAGTLPDPEDLVALRDGGLEPEAEAALQQRLALQPAAAREFLDLASFAELEPPDDEHRLSTREVDRQLAAVQAQILQEDETMDARPEEAENPATPEPMAEVVQISALRYRQLKATAWAFAAAALLAIAVGTFSIGALDRRLEEATGPRFARVIDIATTRGPRELTVSPDAAWIELLIHGVDMEAFARGQLVISSEGGEVLHRREFQASRDGDSLLAVSLPRELLPDGSYRIEVFGLDARGKHLLKDDRLVLGASEMR